MKKYQSFLSKNFLFLEVKFSIYLNRRVFVMKKKNVEIPRKAAFTEHKNGAFPANTQCRTNVVTTSLQRHNVAAKLLRRCCDVVRLLGLCLKQFD